MKQTIVGVWFPNSTDPLAVCDNPFPKDAKYKLQLAYTLPIPPKDLTGVENKYGGLVFNAQIGKYLHVEEWSRPDLAYMKNCLSSYIVGTNVPAFIGIKYGA